MAAPQRRVCGIASEAASHPTADTKDTRAAAVASDGPESRESVSLPSTGVAPIIAEVADLVRSGRCVAVLAGDEYVPVAVVSSLLQVPHDQARRLLVRGVIPCQVIARRRHALVSDVLAYRDQLRRAREVALDQLVEEAQLLGLGY